MRDLTQLRQTLSGPALTALFDAPWLPVALALVWLMHPLLGALGLGSAVVLIVLAVLGDFAARRQLASANRLAPLTQQQVDALGRQREAVAAMGLLPALQQRFVRLHDRVLVHQQSAQERAARVSGLARAARLLIQAAAMGLGALLVIDGELTGGGMIAAYEVLVATPAVRNLIKEGKTHQLRNSLVTGSRDGMNTLEHSLSQLVQQGVVSLDDAIARSLYPKDIEVRPRTTVPAGARVPATAR